MSSFLHGCLLSQLRSLCLDNKYSYPWSHLLGAEGFLKMSKHNELEGVPIVKKKISEVGESGDGDQ